MRARREACPVKVSNGTTTRTLRHFVMLVPAVLVLSAVVHGQTTSPSPPSPASGSSSTTDQAQEQSAPAVATNEQPVAEQESGQPVLAIPAPLKVDHRQATQDRPSMLAEKVRLAWARSESDASSTLPTGSSR